MGWRERTTVLCAMLVGILLVPVLSGCIERHNQISHRFSGSGEGMFSKELECSDGQAYLRFSFDADGPFRLRIQDGDGHLAYDWGSDEGQMDTSRPVNGSGGTWNATITRETEFSGEYSFTLSC